jgi:hypothetical protein
MPSRAYYLQQAKLYFEMANMSRDKHARGRWIDRANERLIWADALGEPMPEMSPSNSAQPQVQQQQQQGPTSDDKD